MLCGLCGEEVGVCVEFCCDDCECLVVLLVCG